MRDRSLIAAGLLLAVGLSACSGGSSGPHRSYPYPPAPGTAVEVGQPPATSGYSGPVVENKGTRGDGGPDFGTLALPDGSILSCGLDRFSVASFTPGAKPLSIYDLPVGPVHPEKGDRLVYGFARTPDGTIYLGWDGVLYAARSSRLDDLKPISALTPADARPATGPAPATAEAAAFRFSAQMRPIGAWPDGSVVVLDGDTLWAFQDGHLTRLLRAEDIPDSVLGTGSGTGRGTRHIAGFGTVATVDAQGTVWFTPRVETDGSPDLPVLTEVIGLTRTGALTSMKLPSALPPQQTVNFGVEELTAMTPDGKDGFYVRIGRPGTAVQQVVHVTPTKVELIAQSTVSVAEQVANRPPNFGGQVDALHIPLFLPTGIAVRPGMLVLLGSANYAIAIGLPKEY